MRARLTVSLVLIAIGVVWIGQGVGAIGGSFMTGEAVWAVIGAVCVFFGGALLIGARRSQRDRGN
jgi:peptidoglycan/LPS O-acetylase OafA/YrhL